MDSRRKSRTTRRRGSWGWRRARAIAVVRGVMGHRVGPTPRRLRLTVRGMKRLRELGAPDEWARAEAFSMSLRELREAEEN